MDSKEIDTVNMKTTIAFCQWSKTDRSHIYTTRVHAGLPSPTCTVLPNSTKHGCCSDREGVGEGVGDSVIVNTVDIHDHSSAQQLLSRTDICVVQQNFLHYLELPGEAV